MNAKLNPASSISLEPDTIEGLRTFARWRQNLLREAHSAECGQRIVDLAAPATGAKAALLVLDDGAGRGRIVAARGLDARLAAAFAAPLDETLEAALAAGCPPAPGSRRLTVPLRNREGLSGLLAADVAPDLAADPETTAVLETLADVAVTALGRSRSKAGTTARREVGSDLAAPAGRHSLMKLLDSLDVGYWRMEYSDQSLHWEGAARRLWWMEPEEPLSLELFWSRIHPEDRTATDNAYQNALRDHTSYTVEMRICHPVTGELRRVRSIGQAVYDAEGTPLRLQGISLDITDLRRSEDEVRRLNQDLQRRIGDLQTILDTAPFGLAIADEADASRIRGNPAAERMLGLEPGSELSKSAPQPVAYRIFRDGLEFPTDELPVQRAIRGETVSGQIMEVERMDGQRIVVYHNAAPLWDETGRPRGAVGAFLDITPLKRAEAALHRSEARFRLLADTAGMLLASKEPGNIVHDICRKVAAHLNCEFFLNFLVDEKTGRARLNAAAGIHGLDLARLFPAGPDLGLSSVAPERGEGGAESPMASPAGPKTEWLHDLGIKAYASHPLTTGSRLLGTLVIGDRHRPGFSAEEVEFIRSVANQVAIAIQRMNERAVLQASEERYRSLVEQALNGIFVMSPDGLRCLDVNTAGAALFGYGRAEVLELDPANLLDPAERDRLGRELEVLKNGDILISEWTFLRRDGSRFPGEMRGCRLADGRLLIILIDITERRQAEMTLRTSEQRLRWALQVAGGVWDYSVATDEIWASAEWYEIWGIPPDMPLCPDVIIAGWARPEHRVPMRERFAHALASGDDYSDQFSIDHPLRGERWISAQGRVFQDESGRPLRVLGIARDITEFKRAERERELASQRRKMEDAFRFAVAIQTAAAIAHELHQPLTALASYAEVARLVADLPNPDGNRLGYVLDCLEQQAHRAGQVMRQLLDLLQQGEAASERVDLRGTLDDALDLLREDGELTGVAVELEMEDHLPLVQANRLQVEKVFVNLLRNGVDSVRELGLADAVLRVRAQRRGCGPASVQVTVSDSGKGLDAGALDAIFGPFYTTKTKGLGMGLAVSRALIEACGGKLWAEPNPERGASFHFTLPIAP